jgi:pimeloyl-ACP methyl ester carboxylesterase
MGNARRNFVLGGSAARGSAILSPNMGMAQSLSPVCSGSAVQAGCPASRPLATLANLKSCIGGDWPVQPLINVSIYSTLQAPNFKRYRINYTVQGPFSGDPNGDSIETSLSRIPGVITAWVLIPNSATGQAPVPGVCVFHQHDYSGKDGSIAGNPTPFAEMLANSGYAVICPDFLGFGERRPNSSSILGATYPNIASNSWENAMALNYMTRGKSFLWKNVLDMKRAIDALTAFQGVNPNRIGCYGHSMGSTNALMCGMWDSRIKVTVGDDLLPLVNEEQRGDSIDNMPYQLVKIPGWSPFGDPADIIALNAPKPLMMILADRGNRAGLLGCTPGTPINGQYMDALRRIHCAYSTVPSRCQSVWGIGTHDDVNTYRLSAALGFFQAYL